MKNFIYLLLITGLQACGLEAVEFNNGSISGPLHVADPSINFTNLLLIIIMITLFVISHDLSKIVNKKQHEFKQEKERLTEDEIEDIISNLKIKK